MKKIFLLGLIFLISCGNSKQEEIDQLADEVMYLHDEVMPLMDNLYKTRIALQKQVQSDSSATEETMQTILDLKTAEDAMMDWMHNFNLTYKGETDRIDPQVISRNIGGCGYEKEIE